MDPHVVLTHNNFNEYRAGRRTLQNARSGKKRKCGRNIVVQSLSHVRFLVTPWTAALQASLSFHPPPEFAQTYPHWLSDTIQPSPLSPTSLPDLNLSQHQGLFQWVSSSHQVARVLELQLQHQSFQWMFRVDFFRIDWFDLLAVQETLRAFSSTTVLKHQFFSTQPSLWTNSPICTWLLEKS